LDGGIDAPRLHHIISSSTIFILKYNIVGNWKKIEKL